MASKLFNLTSSFFLLSHKRTSLKSSPLLRIQSYCATSSPTLQVADPTQASHPWPEWESFVEKLSAKGYFKISALKLSEDDDGSAGGEAEEGIGGPSVNRVKNACLTFARERYDILSSLPKESVKSLVEFGCPDLIRKAVNSAKRLRQYLQLEEANACGACSLRESCDKAYVIPPEGQAARTVDVVRILLSYAVNAENLSGGAISSVSDGIQETARNLLTEIIMLSDTEIDPSCPKPVLVPATRKEPSTKASSKERQSSSVEMKRGDWLCPNCNFLNFSRNIRCLECKHDGPRSVDVEQAEMKPGDWTCPTCKFMNFARNRKCFRCEGARPKRLLKPGEWECPSCYYLNFRGNKVCRKCNADVPEDEGGQFQDHLWKKPKIKFDSSKFGDEDREADDPGSDVDDMLPRFKEHKYEVSKRATPAERRMTSARKRSNFSDLVSGTE